MVEIPIDIEPDPDDPGQALPYVDVEIGGETLRALLDTGAGRTTVMPPGDATIEIRSAEGTGVFGVQGGDRRVWRTSIRFGGRVVGPIEIDTHPAGVGRDLIGQDLLSHFRCEHGLADRRLCLDGSLPPDAVPIFIGEGGHVYLEVMWPAARDNGERCLRHRLFGHRRRCVIRRYPSVPVHPRRIQHGNGLLGNPR